MWDGPKGELEYLVNVMWPLSEFTADNGATVIWPGSHRPDYSTRAGDPGVAPAMAPGSALLFLGSTLHGGGANVLAARVSEALGSTPVVTTATDSMGLPALDQLGSELERFLGRA